MLSSAWEQCVFQHLSCSRLLCTSRVCAWQEAFAPSKRRVRKVAASEWSHVCVTVWETLPTARDHYGQPAPGGRGWVGCEEQGKVAWSDSCSLHGLWGVCKAPTGQGEGLCLSVPRHRVLVGTAAILSEIHHPWLLPLKYQGY